MYHNQSSIRISDNDSLNFKNQCIEGLSMCRQENFAHKGTFGSYSKNSKSENMGLDKLRSQKTFFNFSRDINKNRLFTKLLSRNFESRRNIRLYCSENILGILGYRQNRGLKKTIELG